MARRSFHERTAPAPGFTLIEVLVALIIISVGMLGLAKIETLAYASTGIASTQSLAALQASSLASTMHANRNFWSTANALSYVAVGNATPQTSLAALNTAVVCTLGAAGTAAPCTATQLAAGDLQSWVANLNTLLPNPTATITCPAPVAPALLDCTIQINWVETAVAINAQSAGQAPMSSPTYTLYVVP